MIHTTTNTSKFKRLVRRVRAALGELPIDVETICVGLLERLWHATISNAFRGDIGKLDDEEIAEAIGWHGDAQQIISILVETKWIDLCQTHRLIIHDWKEHAPNHVKGNVARHGGFAISGDSIGSVPKELPQGNPAPNQTKQDQTKHNQTLPTNYRACDSALEVFEFSFEDLSEHARQIFAKAGYEGHKGKNLWKFAALWKSGRISEDELFDSCQNASEKGKDPPAYVFTCLRERLRERPVPVELADLLKTVKINPYCPSEAPQDALR